MATPKIRAARWIDNQITAGLLAKLSSAVLAIALALPGICSADEPVEGLTGLLPSEIPEGIDRIGQQKLPSELLEFGEKITAALSKLYGFEAHSLASQQETLAEIQLQMGTLYQALENPEYSEYFDTLADIEGKLSRRIDLLQAVLRLLGQAEGDSTELRQELKTFLVGIEAYEADSLEGNAAVSVHEQLAKLSRVTGDVSDLEEIVRIHYYNFNLRTFVSEPFAEYAFNECRRECGPVCDFILGARVSGTQRTNSGVSINFIPSDDSAKFSIGIQGNTRSNTRGVTDQATVFTYGNHYFTGKKIISYRDDTFSWQRASLGVNPNNTVTDAKLNRRTLLAKLIGDKIAYTRAVEMTPKTESIAASRVRSRVLPKFNREVEDTFSDLNEQQVKRRERMAQEKIAPNETLSRTDHDEIRNAERLMNPGQLAADRPTKLFNSPTGMTIHIHESWINNALARQTLQVPAPEISFPDFGKMLTEKFERAFDFEMEREPAEEDGDRVLVYDTDPLHVQFDNGKIRVILRIGLHQAGREDIIKHRRVEIPLKIILEEDVIRLAISDDELDRVRVLPLDPEDKRPIANRIIGDKIRDKISRKLAEKTFDRHLIHEAGKNKDKEIPVTIAELHAVNGWMIIVVEPTSDENLHKAEKQSADTKQ